MNLRSNHAAARAFQEAVLNAAHGAALLYHVQFRAQACASFGLVVQVSGLPVGAFHAIRMGPCPVESVNGPLLSRDGQALWDQLHRIALRVVAEAMPAGCLAALILQPSAIERARDGLKLARAA